MRVGINATLLLAPLTGIGQYTWHLAWELSKCSGFDPYYYYHLRGWQEDGLPRKRDGLERTARAAARKMFPAWLKDFIRGTLGQVVFSYGAFRHRIDVYHEPNYVAYQFDGPLVLSIHDLSHIRHPEVHPSSRVRLLERAVPRAAKKASAIIVGAEFVKQEVVDLLNVDEAKVHVIHNGVSEQYRPMGPEQTEACMAKYHLAHKGYILVVGTLEPRKNVLQAVRAHSRLDPAVRREYPLVIAGARGWLFEDIEVELRSYVRTREVRMLGYVPQELLPQLYAGAAVFVYPSIYEGFGLPPLEAMASGVPVITSNRSSLPEVVGNVGIQVDPFDVEGMREAIMSVLGDRQAAIERGAQGVERAKTFTWERCVARTVDVYRRVHRERAR